jgi:hypothetical protein
LVDRDGRVVHPEDRVTVIEVNGRAGSKSWMLSLTGVVERIDSGRALVRFPGSGGSRLVATKVLRVAA